MSHRISRRSLVRRGAGVAALLFGEERAANAEPASRFESVLVVVLSGGADALSLVVPYRDDAYYRARPHTAVARPGHGAHAAIAIDAELGLHPALSPLCAVFDQGQLGVFLGVGSAQRIRSHTLASRALDRSIASALRVEPERLAGTFPRQVATACARLSSPFPPRALRLTSSGWDTHVAQGDGGRGRLTVTIQELAEGLAALQQGVSARRERTLIVVLGEFGRSVAETLLAGTDDGDASLLLVLGAPELAGCHGRYPRLEADALSGGRHLPVTLELSRTLERSVRGESPFA